MIIIINVIISAEGSQQGDPHSDLQFCESIHPTLIEREAQTTLRFVDDIDLEGMVSRVARDVQTIVDSRPQTGLLLNIHKCEITTRNLDIIDKFQIFQHFKKIPLEDMTQHGAPVLVGRAVDAALKDKVVTLGKQHWLLGRAGSL